MAKWNVILSTTEPYNYVGMIQVRQGNKNTEVMEATIVENGLPYDLSECKVYFESVVGGKYPVQLETKIVDAKKGKLTIFLINIPCSVYIDKQPISLYLKEKT